MAGRSRTAATPVRSARLPRRRCIPTKISNPITSRKVAACRTSTSARASVSRSAIELTSAAPSPGRRTAPPTGHSPGSASRCGSCSDVEASRAGQELIAAASSRKWERVRQQRRQGTVNPVCVVVLGSLGLDHRSGFGLGKVNVAGSEKNELQDFLFGSEIENGYDTDVLAGSRKRQRSEDPHPWLTSAHDR